MLLAYCCFLFNKKGNITHEDAIYNITSFITVVFMNAIFINISWLITSASIFLSTMASLGFYAFVMGYHIRTIFFPFQFLITMAILTCFLCEKRFKEEFLQIKKNEYLNVELKVILDNLPEGIVIKELATNQILMVN